MDSMEQFLRDLPLFSAFSDESMKQLLDGTTIRTYAPEEIMIHSGQQGNFLGIMLEGEAEAVKIDQSGRKRVLGKIEKGRCFGEISLMTDEHTTADVIAT